MSCTAVSVLHHLLARCMKAAWLERWLAVSKPALPAKTNKQTSKQANKQKTNKQTNKQKSMKTDFWERIGMMMLE